MAAAKSSGGPSPWLSVVIAAVGCIILIGSNLLTAGRESGAVTSELKAVREDLARVGSNLASLQATVSSARSETRTEVQRVVDNVTTLSMRVVDVEASQRGAEKRWEDSARAQDIGIREVREVLTAMRDLFIRRGLGDPPPPVRTRPGSTTSPESTPDLRRVLWTAPLRISLPAR